MRKRLLSTTVDNESIVLFIKLGLALFIMIAIKLFKIINSFESKPLLHEWTLDSASFMVRREMVTKLDDKLDVWK